ncbi:hypothetical protein GWK91_06385 [Virgibacillus sp. MSP4-1]|uniref:YphA family membrane protein n=1 Tax=Virgibacillus sp. MSP4-1 TaxID=2700081 RepID=UPI0003A281FF|nr:hypothetical protein [Virgibacillus sp. MSP4-1]QHS22598.1 hypothetical protein GWK91_06385 [Virgibacillus sp. MSP4-1]
METWIFYWLAWVLWIIVYFFDFDLRRRFCNSSFVLGCMITSTTYISYSGLEIHVPLIMNGLTGFILLAKLKGKFIPVSIAMSLSFAYSGLKLWELFNPLWLFLSSSIIMALICILVFYIFVDDLRSQLAIALISTSAGQLLFTFVRLSYGFAVSIGDLAYLTDVVFIMITLTLWFKIRRFSEKIEQTVKTVSLKFKT